MVSFLSFWLLSALSFSGIFCLGTEEEKVQVVDLVTICKGRNHKVHVNPTIATDQKRGLLDRRHLQLTVKVFMKLFLQTSDIARDHKLKTKGALSSPNNLSSSQKFWSKPLKTLKIIPFFNQIAIFSYVWLLQSSVSPVIQILIFIFWVMKVQTRGCRWFWCWCFCPNFNKFYWRYPAI